MTSAFPIPAPSLFDERWVQDLLNQAERFLEAGEEDRVASALLALPPELLILLYFDRPQKWGRLSAWLPTLPSEADQRHWTGSSGLHLMLQASVFLDDVFAHAGKLTADLRVLDYGCGWGRMLRLLYNRVRLSNIYGVDPWPPSHERLEEHGVRGKLALIDYVPTELPFGDVNFDVIFAFSVFTHIGEQSQRAVLGAMRKRVAQDGILALTIRQASYWTVATWPDAATREQLWNEHINGNGFAFASHGASEGGHQTDDYGDVSISLDYIRREWKEWRLDGVRWHMTDDQQITVFLRPA